MHVSWWRVESNRWVEASSSVQVTAPRVQTGSNWCLVLEEDALASDNLLAKFLSLIHSQLAAVEDVAYLKLFTADRWDGWETEDLPAQISVCVVAGLAAGWTWWMCMLRLRGASTGLALQRITIIAVAVCAALLISAQLMGKQTLYGLVAPAGYSVRPQGKHHAAGAVAIAYPRSGLLHVLHFLQGVDLLAAGPAIDVRLGRNMPAAMHLRVLEVTPSLIQHIGAYSSGYRNSGDMARTSMDSAFHRN